MTRPLPTMALQVDPVERQIRDSVRNIVESFGPDYLPRCQQHNEPPAQLWKALANAGFIGINLPTEYGGGGMGLTGLRI